MLLSIHCFSICYSLILLRRKEKNKYSTNLVIGAPTQSQPGHIQIFLAINTAPRHRPNIYAKKIWSVPMPNGCLRTVFIFFIFKFYVMYHLILSSSVMQIWQSTNGWRVTVIRGRFSSRSRCPAPGSKRWLALLP